MPSTLLVTLALLLTPPSGRPPEGPLDRYDPEIYSVAFEVQVAPPVQRNQEYQIAFRLENAPIVMPIIPMGTFSRVDADSLRAQLWLNGIEDTSLAQRTRLDGGYPFHVQLAVMPIPKFEGHVVRWRITFRSQSWSSRIDERGAATIPWPREWPKEVQDGLKPQMYIESDDPIFAETIERISGGDLRLVPPYLAAKDIVRHCVQNVRVDGTGLERRNLGMVHGLTVYGARNAVEAGIGSPHDLVCVCVAMLRAAGIPARPVIGLIEKERWARDSYTPSKKKEDRIVSWGEFYLPGAGWIPFDPRELRGKSHGRDVRQPWPDFGTMEDLNERVPLSYHYIPPASVEVPEFPAIWGWSPVPERPIFGVEQFITVSMTSRGKGVDDER